MLSSSSSNKVCILTDSTAQFPALMFPGHDLVTVLPLHVQIGDQVFTDGKDIKITHLPPSARGVGGPQAIAPTVEEFHQAFSSLSRRYREIVAVLVSGQICPALANAQAAIETLHSPASIHIIDSQTTAIGLGLLVQSAAEAAQNGMTGAVISRLVRGNVPRVYTVFCVQSLSYLYRSGHLDPAQAIVGEMLGVTPFFILENGRLVPIQKVRSSRHLVDILHEFITEFGHLKHIALLQGNPPFDQEVRNLRERLNGDYPAAIFSEHMLGAALATILGPRSLGLVAVEFCTDAN